MHNSGFIGGGQVGYNFQFANSWLVGIETDIQGTGAKGNGTAFGVAPITGTPFVVQSLLVHTAVDYLGTVRGRIGFLATTLLIYGDGGFAYGGVHEDSDITSTITGVFGLPATLASFSNTRVGWTAGGGVEWMFSPNWSVKVEYLYYDLGRARFNAGPKPPHWRSNFTPPSLRLAQA